MEVDAVVEVEVGGDETESFPLPPPRGSDGGGRGAAMMMVMVPALMTVTALMTVPALTTPTITTTMVEVGCGAGKKRKEGEICFVKRILFMMISCKK